MGSHGYMWVPMGLLGSPGFLKVFKVLKNIFGTFWFFGDICRFPVSLVGSSGFRWVLLGSLWWVG